jgi:allophanate hydrolase
VTPLTLDALRAAYAAGTTVDEVVGRALDRLAAPDAEGVLIGGPLADAAAADVARLQDSDPATLPLYGVPFLVKDNIDVAGAPTTAGCPSFAYRPAGDATVVARLRAAGAVVVGKANLDQFATGLVGTRSPYGTPRNVIDPVLIPGGSSAGSAVGVALGAVAFALGTDTAGSGRVPAAMNRVVGLKPTRGRLSTAGVVPAVRRMDCVSVFASSLADAASVTAIAAGPDPLDPWSRTPGTPLPARQGRIGVPAGWDSDPELAPAVRDAFAADLASLVAVGFEVVPVDFEPFLAAGRLLYGGALVAERFAAVGHVLDGRADLNPVVAAIIARATDWTAVDAYQAEYRLAELAAATAPQWRDIQALALPTTPIVPTLAEVAGDPTGVNVRLGRYTTFVNLLDLASVVVPSTAPGPYGLQLVGPAWSDDDLVAVAASVTGERLPLPALRGLGVVVVGAHLRGQPLNHQLVAAGARFVRATTTSASYRLHALAGTVPPKPGLERVEAGGAPIEVELWDVPLPSMGALLAQVPPPLCIGSIELADGSWCHGFLCEPHALATATDITSYGGWRGYLAGAHPAGSR